MPTNRALSSFYLYTPLLGSNCFAQPPLEPHCADGEIEENWLSIVTRQAGQEPPMGLACHLWPASWCLPPSSYLSRGP